LLLAKVTTIPPLYLPGNSMSYAPFGHASFIELGSLRNRGREAGTGWVWGLFSGQGGEQVEGEA